MKKNEEVIEFFICPHCQLVSWERVDFIPFTSKAEYSCLVECDHCGTELLAIDHVSRCTKCEEKVECMAKPLKHTFVVAMMPSSEIKYVKELLSKISN